MIAAVAVGAHRDLKAAAALAPAHSAAVMPQRTLDQRLDDAYERYRELVMRLVTTTR